MREGDEAKLGIIQLLGRVIRVESKVWLKGDSGQSLP